MPSRLSDAEAFGRVYREIDPRCEMYRYAVNTLGSEKAYEYYFHSARFLVERLLPVIRDAGIRPNDSTILDFACGFGRFARFFSLLFERVTASDLEPEMVEFCRERLGVDTLLSSCDPSKITADPHDIVFCFSLFTHLPEPLWSFWLQRLWSWVRPGGLLVFSTRGTALGERMKPKAPRGLPAASLTGTCVPVLSVPHMRSQERTLNLYGIRVAIDGAEGTAVEAAVWLLLRISGACTVADAESSRSDPVVSAVPIRSVTTTVSSPTTRITDLEVSIGLEGSCPVADTPIGAIAIPLRYEEPTSSSVVLVQDPSIQIRSMSNPCAAGFSFRPANETGGRLAAEQYGSMTVTQEFVETAVSRLPWIQECQHFPGGQLDLFQDITVVRKLGRASGSR